MTSNTTERKHHDYYIKLPINEALDVRDQLETTIWEIARSEGIEETLRESQFKVQVGKPALDPFTVITVVIVYLGMKTADKVTDKVLDKVWEAWEKKILPELQRKFGKNVLVDENDDEETN